MDDLAGLQEKLAALDKLLQALMPFVSLPVRKRLERLRQSIQPFSQLQEMMEMMEVVSAMQEMSSATGAEINPEDGEET